jgi:sugar porter (SP) family MFS transporter
VEGWRLSYGGNIVFAILMIILLFFMPESPRWLAAHGTEEQVKAALGKVRFEDEVEPELKKLKHEVEEEQKLGVAPWSEVFSEHLCMRRRVALGVAMMGFQQLCGINAVMFYAPDILAEFFSDDASITGAFILNVINFLATFITVFTIDHFGRTKLLVSGGSVMFPCLLVLGILSLITQTKAIGFAVIIVAGLYVIGFAFSWGPVLWVLVGEMFPYRTRGKAAGTMVMSNWIFTTIVGAVFPAAQNASLAGCFFFFAAMIFIGNSIVYFFQPETMDKTSDQIDEAYKNHQPALKRKVW